MAGAITGAQFIQRFVEKDTPWAHLDVAGTAMGSPASETNQSWGSGWGVGCSTSSCAPASSGGKQRSRGGWRHGELLFYHLERQPLESALPGLLQRSLERGWRVVVKVGSEERLEALNAHLWSFDDASFLPHGAACRRARRGAADLADNRRRQSERRDRALPRRRRRGGRSRGYERIVFMFDAADQEAVAKARAAWKAAGAASTTPPTGSRTRTAAGRNRVREICRCGTLGPYGTVENRTQGRRVSFSARFARAAGRGRTQTAGHGARGMRRDQSVVRIWRCRGRLGRRGRCRKGAPTGLVERLRQPEVGEQRGPEGGDLGDPAVDDAEDVELERPVRVVAGGAQVARGGRHAVGDGRERAASRPRTRALASSGAISSRPSNSIGAGGIVMRRSCAAIETARAASPALVRLDEARQQPALVVARLAGRPLGSRGPAGAPGAWRAPAAARCSRPPRTCRARSRSRRPASPARLGR